jgi:hypothetical protein
VKQKPAAAVTTEPSYVLLILETDVAQLRRFRTDVIPCVAP